MVHSMLHWAGVPNKLGQANELKYFTGNAIYHTDTYTNNLQDPEKMLPNR